MQQELPFSIGFHTLFFLFTGCALPVLCISSVCLSRLLFSCPQVRNHSVLKGCMAPYLQLSLTLPSIDKAARWITAYLTESSKSPASIARSNKQWVGICLYQEWCKPLLISCEAARFRAAVLWLHSCPRPSHPSSPRIRFLIDRSRDKASIAALSWEIGWDEDVGKFLGPEYMETGFEEFVSRSRGHLYSWR